MLHVERTGTGDAVVMLHSSGFGGWQWKRLAAAVVARGFTAVVPDLTGHGRSPAWPEPTPFSYRVDIAHATELLPAHLVGHSYGGLVALQAALEAPDRVRSLALYDPVAFAVLDPIADADERASLPHALQWDDPERWLRTFVEYWSGTGAWDGLREPMRAEFRRTGWVLSEGVRSLMVDATPLAAYASLAVPTLLLTGQHSPIAARRVCEHLAATLPHARLEVIAGAGHMGPLTHPKQVEAAILATL